MASAFFSNMPHCSRSGPTPFGMAQGMNMDLFSDFLIPIGAAISASFEEAAVAEAKKQAENFEVRVKSGGCKPEELDVSVVDGHLIVSGKHEEREENGSFVARSFTRRFPLPKNVNLEAMSCKFDVKGQLTISAPLFIEEKPSNVINIPIQHAKKDLKEPENSKQGEMEVENKLD